MFYNRYNALCRERGESASGVAVVLGISKAAVSTWKNQGYTPRPEQLKAIANYFSVPANFLLELDPFQCWEMVNENRSGFFYYIPLKDEALKFMWGIDRSNLSALTMVDLINFMDNNIQSISADDDGNWIITPKGLLKASTDANKKEPPAPEGAEGRLTDRQKYLLDLITGLPEERQAEARSYLEWLAAQNEQ